jgi:hypothetical protein
MEIKDVILSILYNKPAPFTSIRKERFLFIEESHPLVYVHFFTIKSLIQECCQLVQQEKMTAAAIIILNKSTR